MTRNKLLSCLRKSRKKYVKSKRPINTQIFSPRDMNTTVSVSPPPLVIIDLDAESTEDETSEEIVNVIDSVNDITFTIKEIEESGDLSDSEDNIDKIHLEKKKSCCSKILKCISFC